MRISYIGVKVNKKRKKRVDKWDKDPYNGVKENKKGVIVVMAEQVYVEEIKDDAAEFLETLKRVPEERKNEVLGMGKPIDTIILKDTLAAVQKDIKENTKMMFFSRGAEDDPCIQNVWIWQGFQTQ